MLIYENTTNQFVHDVKVNKISDIMVSNFQSRFGRKPGASEVSSWQNSLPRVSDVMMVQIRVQDMLYSVYSK